ncbi:MAG: KOW motif-containing protein [Candidatus Hodarchaeales archaeon]|jgi:hypothetical protein
MTDIHQVIVKNVPPKGLDVVAATVTRSQIQDLSQYIPKKRPKEFNGVYLTKFLHNSGKIGLRFTFDDGTDQFGRKAIKTHTLIIDNSFYNANTALYFISPLLNKSLTVEGSSLLRFEDFESIEPHPISSKLVETLLCKKHVSLESKSEQSPYSLIHIFSTLDRIIPPLLTSRFSFQTFIDQSQISDAKKISLVYSNSDIANSIALDQIKDQVSEYPTVRALTDSLHDLPTLRGLQKQIFLGIPEKRLNFRIHLRFGIKTFAHIKKTLEMGLHVNDLIKIVDGPYRGKKAHIEEIDSDNDQLSVILIGKGSKRPITIPVSSVYLMEPLNSKE